MSPHEGETVSDIYVSASGAIARLHDLDVVANNLANADTAGFRRDLTIFEVAVQSALRDVERENVPGSAGRALTGIASSTSDYGSGPITETGKPLDVAILGPGWFEVETPQGLRYTRAGAFAVDPEQRVVTPDGHPVQGAGGELRTGAGIPEFTPAGDLVDSTGATLGQLKLVDFERLTGFAAVTTSADLWTAFADKALSPWLTHHQYSNLSITIDGDEATAIVYMVARHAHPQNSAQWNTQYGWYRNRFRRCDGGLGWKISELGHHFQWLGGQPDLLDMSGAEVAALVTKIFQTESNPT